MPTSVTLIVSDNSEIKATITPDTAPQTVTATTAGTDLIGIEVIQ